MTFILLNILVFERGVILKRFISVLFLVLFISVSFSYNVSALDISAKYACVIDKMSGNILYEKNAHEKHSMASTTKIMTALVALENNSTDEIVTVSNNASGTEGSSIYLKPGEKIPLEDLLYGLMLASGNDAAIAIAEHVGKSVENFAKMMTDKAKSLGAQNTSFKNPNGLDEEGHFTTAYDLALITKAAMKNEKFAEIVKTKTKQIANPTEDYGRVVTNHNKLLNLYEGCVGVKTGFTKKTGRCLVSAANRDGFEVIAVTLAAPDDWNDHKKMLDAAFESVEKKPLIIKDMVLKTVPVLNGDFECVELLAEENFFITPTSENFVADIKLDYKIPEKLSAPLKKGDKAGWVDIYYKTEFLGKVGVVSGIDVVYKEMPKPDFFDCFKKVLGQMFRL